MNTATLHLHGELARLVPRCLPDGRLDWPVTRRAALVDVLESLGLPRTEVYALAADGQEAEFGHIVNPGQILEAFPGRPPVDPTAPSPLRPALARLAFAADANVGRLATWLTMLGFDTAWRAGIGDEELASLSARQGRVVLTRDRGLLKRKLVTWGRLILADDPVEQVRDVVRFFGLAGRTAPFSRCLRCNAPLLGVEKAQVLHLLQERTARLFERFSRCPSCGRTYWAGSHHERMLELVDRLTRP